MATAKFDKEKVKIFCQKTLFSIEKQRIDDFDKAIRSYITTKERQKKESWFRFFVRIPTYSEVEEMFKFSSGFVPLSTHSLYMSEFWETERLCKRLIPMCVSTMDNYITLDECEVDLLNRWGTL